MKKVKFIHKLLLFNPFGTIILLSFVRVYIKFRTKKLDPYRIHELKRKLINENLSKKNFIIGKECEFFIMLGVAV